MAAIKIRQGTPTHTATSLCESCRRAIVVRGRTLDEEIIQCGALSGPFADRIVFRVTSCNRYDDRSRPSLNSMTAIAWELRTDTEAKQIGFMSPDEISQQRSSNRHPRLRPMNIPEGLPDDD